MTYFLAYWWQHSNTKEVGDPATHKYTYENWIKLIEDVFAFNKEYTMYTSSLKMDSWQDFFLFVDWSTYGNGMFLPEIKAVATFDPNGNKPIQVLP